MTTFKSVSSFAGIFCLAATGIFAAAESASPEKPMIPKTHVGTFISEHLDITSFRSSLGPRRSPGMRHFADLGMKPTRVSDQLVEFDSDDWLFGITVLERADKNGDGVEDLVVRIEDHAKVGTYRGSSKLLLTRFPGSGDLIAIAFDP